MRWYLWCLTSVLGGASVSCIAWVATSVRGGYSTLFMLDFAAVLGGLVGLMLSAITGVRLRSWTRVWWGQIVGFGVAAAIAIPVAYFFHAILAAPVSIGTYLFVLTMVAKRGLPKAPSGLCDRCEYDLRGSPQAGRCPECGTRFDPKTIRSPL